LPKSGNNPTLDRRVRVIARLEEQKLLLNDSAYMRSVRSWSKGEDGKRMLVESKQRVLPCGPPNLMVLWSSSSDQVGNRLNLKRAKLPLLCLPLKSFHP